MKFTEFASLKNIILLSDDINFLHSSLDGLKKPQRIRLLKEYVRIWCETRDSCNNSIRADNEGRKAANNYILEYIDAVRTR